MSTTMANDLPAASREAMGAVRSRLADATAQSSSGDLVTTSEQLDAVADLLVREPVLRRTLADSSTAATEREGLASRLVGSQVSTATAEVVSGAVSATWSRSEDLTEGLRLTAREALLVAAERDGRLDAVEDELFRLGRVVGGQPDLERLLSDPTASVEGKQRVVDRLLADKAEPVTRRLASQLVAHPVGRSVAAGLERLAGLAAERRERSVAVVRSAVALSEAQQERLASALGRIYRREITVHLEVDPDVLGGLVVQVGDEVIDGSAAGRLDEVSRRLG